MASRNRAVSRALTRSITPRLGNLKDPSGGSGRSGKGPAAGTLAVNFQSPGMPQVLDQDSIAYEGQAYAQNLFVMRCVQTISSTIAGLPFRAGMDPMTPADFDPYAPMAQLLGPATPQAPGGPNPTTSSRMFWDWSIKQFRIYGRWAWETQLAKMVVPGSRRRTQDAVVALWPLPAPYVSPIPTDGGESMFNGFVYQISRGERKLKNDQVFYAHKPGHTDWRLPESVLDSARYTIDVATGIDKYMAKLLQNDMVATTMVVTPPFAESAGRRAFREQFRSRFTGIDKAGGTIFGEAHRATDDTTGNPLVQVERIAQTAVEASFIQISTQSKIDITVALGVPMSLIGNASQRCVDDQTEILTTGGWKTHDQLQVGDSALTLNHDTGLAEWQPVEHISRYEVKDQPMLHLEGRAVDSVTNAPHRWPVLDKATGERRWTTSQDLSTKHQLVTSAPVADLPTEAKYADDFVELVAWYWTEGHRDVTAAGTPSIARITQSNESNPGYCDRIRSALHRLYGAPVETLRGSAGEVAWRESVDWGRDMRRFRLSSAIADDLEAVAPDKSPSVDFVRSLTKAQLELFIDVSLKADGWRSNQGSRVIAQKREDVLEGMALAVLLSGRTPRRWSDANRHYLAVSERTVADVPPPTKAKRARAHRYWEPYTGTIWCPSTGKNASWYARRNGKVIYTGNTYANADSEYKNFWTITILPLIEDIQDYVNTLLAPRLGGEVGWFDLSHVEALKPASLFSPPMIGDVINFGVADAAQVANALGIPSINATGAADTSTVNIDIESSTGTSISGGGGGRSDEFWLARRRAGTVSGTRSQRGEDLRRLYGVTKDQMISARLRYERRPLNTFNVDEPFILQRYIEREHIDVRKPKELTPEADVFLRHVEKVQERRAAAELENRRIRAAAVAERAELLAQNARREVIDLRKRGDVYGIVGADDLEEFLGEADEALERSIAQDNAAYHEGIADHLAGKPKLTPAQFAQAHPDADGDDYPLYEAGYAADRDDLSLVPTWDGDPDTMDAWLDANESALEGVTGDV